MRKYVDIYLSELADVDSNVRLLIADVGDFPVFLENHSDKFINVGVSESNTIGIAAGLASEGYRVFVYGVSSFFIYRAYEQFKYSVSYWQQPVTFIGVGFGWKYYFIGAGHFCPDDILLMRGLPHMIIYTPYTLKGLKTIISNAGKSPAYLRITANIVERDIAPDYQKEILIMTYGEMTQVCLNVANSLKCDFGLNVGLIALESLPSDSLSAHLSELIGKSIVVVEDQCSHGGLSSILKEMGVDVHLHICLPLLSTKIAKSRAGLVHLYGLDQSSIVEQILNLVSHNRNE
jgi:transketolase